MSDKQKDVVIAAYLFEDLAKRDFDAVLKLAEDRGWRQKLPERFRSGGRPSGSTPIR